MTGATTLEEIVTETVADPTGGLYASVYETSRLVTLASWLTGHDNRVAFLRGTQHADGSWGGPGVYSLIPTLGAVEALLSVPGRADLRDPIERGLSAAARLLAQAERTGLPATPMASLIVPALTYDSNVRLGDERLTLPPGMSGEPLAALRSGGWRNPVAAYYLELVGPDAIGSPEMKPVAGVIGCSAAATAAWLGPEHPGPECAESVEFLIRTQRRLGGPVPGMTSMAWFERAWLACLLADSGASAACVDELTAGLPERPGTLGVGAAPGFAEDAESIALLLLAASRRTGSLGEHGRLWWYDRGTHFLTTVPVGSPSVVTNVRILEVVARYLRQAPSDADRYADAVGRITAYLLAQQGDDGAWLDRWHVSPLYATFQCALGLHHTEQGADAVDRATAWIVEHQHDDGSWGVWGGTAEETAYALLTLRLTRPERCAAAVREGRRFLLEHGLDEPYPALWNSKDLYAPVNLIRGAVGAAVRCS
jgi:halimadienyl-diphosphate synthase